MNQEHLKVYAVYDNLLLDEVNVKSINRYVTTIEKGDLYLTYNGQKYSFYLNNKDVTTDQLICNIAPKVLDVMFDNYSVNK